MRNIEDIKADLFDIRANLDEKGHERVAALAHLVIEIANQLERLEHEHRVLKVSSSYGGN